MGTSVALFVWVGRGMSDVTCMVAATTIGTTGPPVSRAHPVRVGAAAVVIPVIVCSVAITASRLEGRGGKVTVSFTHIPYGFV